MRSSLGLIKNNKQVLLECRVVRMEWWRGVFIYEPAKTTQDLEACRAE